MLFGVKVTIEVFFIYFSILLVVVIVYKKSPKIGFKNIIHIFSIGNSFEVDAQKKTID